MKLIKPFAILALLSASGLTLLGLENEESLNTILYSDVRVEVSEPSRLAGQEAVVSIGSSSLRSSEIALSEIPKIPESLKYYINNYDGEITFRGGETVFPKTHVAISRAFSSVGDALSVCLDGKCFNKCDHLAGDIWGYEEASGYYSAMTHWQTAVSQGIAVYGDKEPPLGALLFWETGRPFGHVATYIGNGMVVTNAGGEYGSNVYIYYADWYDGVGYKYLGWAPPVFFGEEPGSAL
jgi:hypothetical protein